METRPPRMRARSALADDVGAPLVGALLGGHEARPCSEYSRAGVGATRRVAPTGRAQGLPLQ
ncbi:MAG: hypothetical protein H5T64_11565 [Chloroflexi bacterium]|nr:hypothetical protein [Chloroflexota bacterium]